MISMVDGKLRKVYFVFTKKYIKKNILVFWGFFRFLITHCFPLIIMKIKTYAEQFFYYLCIKYCNFDNY